MEWRRLGMVKGSDNMQEIPGLPGWTSKRMLGFIIGLSVVFTLVACWYVVTIVGSAVLVIVYNEISMSTSPYNVTEADPEAALDASGIEKEVDALVLEFQDVLNVSQYNTSEVEKTLCPAISCNDFSSISCVATDQCVCDPATLESVNTWAHKAQSCYIAALVAACLILLSASALGLRCMISGATIRVRLQHWEYMQPVLVASEGRSIGLLHERAQSQSSEIGGLNPQEPQFLQTREGVIVGNGGLDVDQMNRDIESYFPATDIENGLVGSGPVVEFESRNSGISTTYSNAMSASVSMNNAADIEGTSSSKQDDFNFDLLGRQLEGDSPKGEPSMDIMSMDSSLMDGTTKRKTSLYQSRRSTVMNGMALTKGLFTPKEEAANKAKKKRRTIVHAYENNTSPSCTDTNGKKNSINSARPLAEDKDTSDETNSTGKSNHYNPFLRWDKGDSDSSDD